MSYNYPNFWTNFGGRLQHSWVCHLFRREFTTNSQLDRSVAIQCLQTVKFVVRLVRDWSEYHQVHGKSNFPSILLLRRYHPGPRQIQAVWLLHGIILSKLRRWLSIVSNRQSNTLTHKINFCLWSFWNSLFNDCWYRRCFIGGGEIRISVGFFFILKTIST